MRKLEVIHKGIPYTFEYLEQSNVIEVVKADVPTYKIIVKSSSDGYDFECNCPGSVWHGHCWHIDGDINSNGFYTGPLSVMFEERITEPWAEWAEEAGRMKYGKSENNSVV